MNIITRTYLFTILLTLVPFFTDAQNTTANHLLLAGAPAPQFKVSEWIKGEPVTGLVKGKISVIEFTTTGCGPCLKAIPHLSAINRKYTDKITMASIFANNNNIREIKKLVETYSAEVDYPVAADMAGSSSMYKNWMQASGRNGFPTVYVVDQNGIIAWIGNPLNHDFDSIVEKVYNGSFDKTEQDNKQKAEEEKLNNEFVKYIEPAVNGGENELRAAIKYLDSMINLNPMYLKPKFWILLNHNETEAFQTLREFNNQLLADAYTLMPLLERSASLKQMDWYAYREICFRQFDMESKSNRGVEYLIYAAEAYFMDNKWDSAIIFQRKAIDFYKKYNPDETQAIEQANHLLDWYEKINLLRTPALRTSYYSSFDTLNSFYFFGGNASSAIPTVTQYNERVGGKKGYLTYGSKSLSTLFCLAYLDDPAITYKSPVQLIYDFKNMDKVEQYFETNGQTPKFYNYTLVVPDSLGSPQRVMKIMQKDLKKEFGFHGVVVKKPLNVWVLTCDSAAAISNKTQSKDCTIKREKDSLIIKAATVDFIAMSLRELNREVFYKTPLINEAFAEGRMDLNLKLVNRNGSLDMAALSSELQKFGFYLKKTTREKRALLITDKK